MRTIGLICSLVMVLLLYAGEVLGATPVAVSPGSGSEVSIITQECPTFSWSGVEGAVSYNIALFEMHTSRVSTYEEMKETARPVISKEIGAPSLSWTPSLEQGLESGKRYVWYVKAISDTKHPGLIEGWSEGKVFEVSLSLSTGTKEVVEGTVREYMTTEWIKSESYKELTKVLTTEVSKGWGAVIGQGTPPKMPAFEGTSNTFYGSGAGYGLSLGDDDDHATFIGYQAGLNTNEGTLNHHGKDNTFVGYYAGRSNTTGYKNTFLGNIAGYSNTTGFSNTFLGNEAGYSNTTGYNNTFLGNGAGYLNTTGFWNTFLGIWAGFSNTTGSDNTFLGDSAGSNNTEGLANTFLGNYAGMFNIIGGYNTFLGVDAGHFNITGYDNTFLGHFAGYSNTTGSSNVFLGNGAGANETGSNKLYIDKSATNTPLIYGEFDNKKVIINGILSIASSREYKENIDQLRAEEAIETLQNLKPVKFSYKVTPGERHAGFISEEVPESLTTRERKAISPMDIVAVLTKVLQEQQKTISALSEELKDLKEKVK